MKNNPSLIGLLQALGITVYCLLIAGLFQLLEKYISGPGFIGMALMLILLVFSAGLCGFIIFGYPAYLILNKRLKEGLKILGFSALWMMGIIFLAIILITLIIN